MLNESYYEGLFLVETTTSRDASKVWSNVALEPDVVYERSLKRL